MLEPIMRSQLVRPALVRVRAAGADVDALLAGRRSTCLARALAANITA